MLNLADIVTTVYGFSLDVGELNFLFPGKSFIAIELLTIKVCLLCIYLGLFVLTYRFCLRNTFPKGTLVLNIELAALLCIYSVVVVNNFIGIVVTKILGG